MLKGLNLRAAFKRVKQNDGAPSTDNMTVAELQVHGWERCEIGKKELQSGTNRPMEVKLLEILNQIGGG